MDANARLDYFRSEFEGKLSQIKKDLAGELAAANERIRQLETRLDKMTQEMKHLELSVR